MKSTMQRKIVFTVFALVLIIIISTSLLALFMPKKYLEFLNSQNNTTNETISTGNNSTLILKIDYANIKPNETFMIPWEQLTNETTVFDVLRTYCNVEYTFYGNLVFIDAINDVRNDQTLKGYWWLYYLDGVYAQQAANIAHVKDTNEILWIYTKI